MTTTLTVTNGSLVLSAGLAGDEVTFANSPALGGTLIVEPAAIDYTTTITSGTTSVIGAYLGGNVEGFGPSDMIVLSNVEQIYDNFDQYNPNATGDEATFAEAASIAALGGIDFTVATDGSVSVTPSYASLYDIYVPATLQAEIATFLDDLDQALFGASPAAAITVGLVAESGSSTIQDAFITATADPNPCYAEGTRIRTARGEVAVEALAEGDVVITHRGPAPITWIGKRGLDLARHPHPDQVQPIRIAAGALDEGVPARDLYVSPAHALYLNGRLICAHALVNGTSIAQVEWRRVTYYHIELATHAVLYAEGAAAESYLDTGNRNAFENAAGEALILHPDFAQSMRCATSCAPFVEAGPVLEAARAWINARVPGLEWGQPAAAAPSGDLRRA